MLMLRCLSLLLAVVEASKRTLSVDAEEENQSSKRFKEDDPLLGLLSMKLSDVTNEVLDRLWGSYTWPDTEDFFYPPSLNYEKQFRFMNIIAQNFPDWFRAKVKQLPVPFRTGFMWRNPDKFELISLPKHLPPIVQLIPKELDFSYEKSSYFRDLHSRYLDYDLGDTIRFDGGYINSALHTMISLIQYPAMVVNPLEKVNEAPFNMSQEDTLQWWTFFLDREKEQAALPPQPDEE